MANQTNYGLPVADLLQRVAGSVNENPFGFEDPLAAAQPGLQQLDSLRRQIAAAQGEAATPTRATLTNTGLPAFMSLIGSIISAAGDRKGGGKQAFDRFNNFIGSLRQQRQNEDDRKWERFGKMVSGLDAQADLTKTSLGITTGAASARNANKQATLGGVTDIERQKGLRSQENRISAREQSEIDRYNSAMAVMKQMSEKGLSSYDMTDEQRWVVNSVFPNANLQSREEAGAARMAEIDKTVESLMKPMLDSFKDQGLTGQELMDAMLGARQSLRNKLVQNDDILKALFPLQSQNGFSADKLSQQSKLFAALDQIANRKISGNRPQMSGASNSKTKRGNATDYMSIAKQRDEMAAAVQKVYEGQAPQWLVDLVVGLTQPGLPSNPAPRLRMTTGWGQSGAGSQYRQGSYR